ncbi:MAG: alpha-glucan family phosphorylase [Acidimicrobiales bacterium]|jgi:starch phosphorylase|nr:alpha-glucan family phosphorylase [Acidimicrobiales bacterium]
MKAVQTFTVVSQLPPQLEPLRAVAMNLGWADDQRSRELFRRLDREAFEFEGRDPALILATESQEQLEKLAADSAFTSVAAAIHQELESSLAEPRWFQHRGESPLREVAYFSPEFGIAAALPQYSGGLGVLAGDHLKAANDLGLPLVAIGLFYRHGYFRQELDVHGWQLERFPRLDPQAMALDAVPDVTVVVDLAGVPVHARLWRAQVGRIQLYLLDTDIDDNDDETRLTCDRLYGGGVEERIRQEIVLGIGGTRALKALGRSPQVFHMNEGHAGFLALERVRGLMLDGGLSFAEARAASRPGVLFTTHTPVPAGIDRFPRELMEKYFSGWCRELGISLDELMALGHEPGTPDGEVFNMAAMGLRMAGQANGVAQLHGDVSRKMFSGLWPEIPVEDVPITAVTNGVHAPTWTSPEIAEIYRKVIGPEWPEASAEEWAAVETVSDRDLWRARTAAKERLVGYARHKLRSTALRHGKTAAQASWTDTALDPDILTIGFARRFATYKRATLLFRDVDRLRRLLLDADQPIQLIFAGKAHPADEPGHHLLQQVAGLAAEIDLRHRLVLLEDYDISVARMLVQGCDVWLNTPLRPNEACGTSGMKVVFNGGLNLSILDGWWDEMYTPEVGWAIPSAENTLDPEARNDLESASVFDILERQVVPLYHRRNGGDLPTDWLAKVKRSMSRLGPQVESTRMLREYVERLYEPAATRSDLMLADDQARARGLVRWTRHLERAWPSVSVPSTSYAPIGRGDDGFRVDTQVALGELEPDDVAVELVYGEVDLDNDLREPAIVAMDLVGDGEHAGWRHYRTEITFPRAGTFGYTVRVVPSHPDIDDYAQLGRVALPQG